MSARQQPLAGADSFWFQAEDTTNLMVINGFLVLEGRLDLDRLKAEVTRGLLGHDRFRRPVLRTDGAARWGSEEGFDPDAHFEQLHLPPPGGELGLKALMSDLVATPLAPDRPLWKVYLVDGHETGSVVVARIHHCIADGIALVQVLLSLAEEGGGPGTRAVPTSEGGLLEHALERVRHTVGHTQEVLHQGWRFMEHLSPSELLRHGHDFGSALSKLTLMSSQDHPAFKGRLGSEKVVGWSAPMSLEPIKAMGRKVDGKVNDVLLAMTAGALRRYLERQGWSVGPGEVLRVTVPVNLRPLAEAHLLGNRFGLVFLHLPVHLAQVEARLEAVKREMDQIKAGAEALVSFGLMQAIGQVPAEVEAQLVDLFSRKASMILTNVPGPQRPLVFAGLPVRRLMFWVPQSGTISLGLSIISYAGEVTLGVTADRGLFPEPQVLADAMRQEHDHMAEVLGV